ncbi:MAG: bifunctional N(6)-L-threonylcarbamoyladenine synthase/serine/threonine protein kinase [Candidatus Woesearchaeota archaeon]
MIVIGIESTAHTLGVSIVKNDDILSNEKELYKTTKGGMIPAKVADHHIEVCDEVLKRALKKSKIKITDVDLISFSSSPGIGHTLRIGAVFSRILSLKLKIPVIGVNHCIAHLEIGRKFSKFKDPILLYASGANTQVIGFESGKYRVFGETLDNGVGNFLDGFAREMGLGFPGGPKIEELAKKGKYVELPYSVKGMDVSFGGLLTKLKNIKHKHKIEDLCFSIQETVFAMLTEVTERALAHTGKNELVLGGGVGCNKRLQEMLQKMCDERGAKFFAPKNEYLVDNAAMIAHLGYIKYNKEKEYSLKETKIDPYLRTDEVEINYR